MTLAKLLLACAVLVAIWLPLYAWLVVRDTTTATRPAPRHENHSPDAAATPPMCWCGQPLGHQLDWVAEILAAPVATLTTL